MCPIPECAEMFAPFIHPFFIYAGVRYSIKCLPWPKVRLASPPAKTSSGSRWKVLAPKEPFGAFEGPLHPYSLVDTRYPKLK